MDVWRLGRTDAHTLCIVLPPFSSPLPHQVADGRCRFTAPISAKIPSYSSSGRLPSNIPLRAISGTSSHGASSSSSSARAAATSAPNAGQPSGPSLLAPATRGRHSSHRRSSSLSSSAAADDDSESWLDTGDIAEHLADDGDNHPAVRARLYDNIDQDTLATALKTKSPPKKKNKHVHYDDSDSRSSQSDGSSDGDYSSDGDSERHHLRRRRSNHHHRRRHHHAGAVDKEAIHIPESAAHRTSAAERFIASIMSGGGSSIHGLTGKPLMYAALPH